jgi:hypothetical protein
MGTKTQILILDYRNRILEPIGFLCICPFLVISLSSAMYITQALLADLFWLSYLNPNEIRVFSPQKRNSVRRKGRMKFAWVSDPVIHLIEDDISIPYFIMKCSGIYLFPSLLLGVGRRNIATSCLLYKEWYTSGLSQRSQVTSIIFVLMDICMVLNIPFKINRWCNLLPSENSYY